MADQQIFDLELVTVLVAYDVLTGYGTGGKLTLKHNTDTMNPVVGCDGKVVYAKSADKSGTAEITLASTSPSLRKLRTLAAAGKQFNFSVMDANREENVRANSDGCVVTHIPDVPRTTTPGDVTVTIYIPRLEYR